MQLLFNILGSRRKEKKMHPDWKEAKSSIFADDIILCIEKSKESTQILSFLRIFKVVFKQIKCFFLTKALNGE